MIRISDIMNNYVYPALALFQGVTVIEVVTAASYEVTQQTGTLVLLCNCTSNVIDITLQTAVGNSATIVIKKTDATANDITINTTSSQTIDGTQPITISVANTSITIVSDNANWKII